MEKISAQIVKEGRTAIIVLPASVTERFNTKKGTIYIKGSINGMLLRAKLISKGGGIYFFMPGKQLLESLGISAYPAEVMLEIENDNAGSGIVSAPEAAPVAGTGIPALDMIYSRVSIRRFKDEPLTDEALDMIILAGLSAPSAKAKRPARFIVIEDKSTLQALAQMESNWRLLSGAAACIAVCGDGCVQGIKEFLLEDCSAAAQNILLAAHGLGMGAVWCGISGRAPLSGMLKELLRLPEKMIAVALIAVGVPEQVRPAFSRYDPDKVRREYWH